MELKTIITLVTVGAIVWGGFLYFLVKAIRCEKKKSENE